MQDKKLSRNDTFDKKEHKEWFLGLTWEEMVLGHSEESLPTLIGQ